MTPMSFSFTAAGTREECIKSLNDSSHHELSSDGQLARGFVLGFLADAPASASMIPPFRYEIDGHGHRDPHRGHAPTLTIRLAVIPNTEVTKAEAAASAGM